MDPRRWQEVKGLLDDALELEPDRRASFLDEQCGADTDVRVAVDVLLGAHARAGDFLNTSANLKSASRTILDPDGSLRQVGPYRIERRIGAGGMGVVYLATQRDPIRRSVALKLIKTGMDTQAVLARFEAERQALALMNHRNVAKVLDAGSTEQGRPYFAMDFVEGPPITDFCDGGGLSIKERLVIFQQVCAGVQHAHQKGVIHRDLKPSNILVQSEDGSAVPKIIDFGIAKATSAQHALGPTLTTVDGQPVGTPEYMSPEQVQGVGQDADTRSDVYSLGVVLYELLCGALPTELDGERKQDIEHIRSRIIEAEPQRPSKRVGGLAAAANSSTKRSATPTSLRRELAGELDSIALRALEKDPQRRYNSPADISADIGRFLRNEPVHATQPSAVYRARKFVRRHKVGVGTAVAGLGVIFAFALTMAVHADRIAEERDFAEQARADLELVADFQSGMLADVDPGRMGRWMAQESRIRFEEATRARGFSEPELTTLMEDYDASMRRINPTNTALEVIDRNILAPAVQTLEERFKGRPLIDARLRATVGETYRTLGRYEAAEEQLNASLVQRQRRLGDDHPDTLSSANSLALVYMAQGRDKEAQMLLLDVFERRQRILGEDHAQTLASAHNLAQVHRYQLRYGTAEEILLEILQQRQGVVADDHPDVLATKNDLAALYVDQIRYAEAEVLYSETLEASIRTLGEEHLQTFKTRSNLASLYFHSQLPEKAEPLFLKSLESARRALGDGHPDTLAIMNNLSLVYKQQAKYPEAEQQLLEVLETQKRMLEPNHPDLLSSLHNLAALYKDQGRYSEAETLGLEALDIRARVLGEDHPDTLATKYNLAVLFVAQRRYEEAEALSVEALNARRRVLPDDHPDLLSSLNNLAAVYGNQGRYEESEPLLLEALEIQRLVLRDDHPHTLDTIHNLSVLYWFQQRYSEAEPMFSEILEAYQRVHGNSHSRTLESMKNLARLYERQERDREAEELLSEHLTIQRKALGDNSTQVLASANYLAWFLLNSEHSNARDLERALQLSLEVAEKTEYDNAGWLDTLSLAYHLTGDTTKAVENQERAIALLPEGDSPLRRSLEEALARFQTD